MADAALKRMSLDEFHAWNPPGDTHYELIGGVPVRMARPGGPHQVMICRLGARIDAALRNRPGCEARIRAGIVPPWPPTTYYEADIAVARDQPDNDCEAKEPILIVEILSPSTEDHDRKVKLRDYRLLPSVREIVLIDAYRLWCEVHRRQQDGRWIFDLLHERDARLVLDSIGLDVPLIELYTGLPAAEA